MKDINEKEFLHYLKFGEDSIKYPTELVMILEQSCSNCEGFEEHEFLGFRINVNAEGRCIEEVWKCCNCCADECPKFELIDYKEELRKLKEKHNIKD